MKIIFFYLLLLGAFRQSAVAKADSVQPKIIDSKIVYMASCNLLDSKFNLIKIISSDWLCLALPDGGWISSDNVNHLSRWDADGVMIWKKKGYYHHQITAMGKDWILTLLAEPKTIYNKKVAFTRIQKIRISDGKVVNEYSIYDGLYKTHELVNTALDKPPIEQPNNVRFFQTDLEKSHINSVMYKDHFVYVNEIEMIGFVLDEQLKFIKYIDYPDSLRQSSSLASHDLQGQGDNSYIFFKNFNEDKLTKKSTFKIYEFKNKEVTFEFPKNPEDYAESDYSGGVDKTNEGYVVGFPVASSPTSVSTVGLVSFDGHWLQKKIFPYRIQDIKKIPFDNYLKLNRIH